MFTLALIVIALGVLVLLFGNRMMFFGAGVGALLGIGLLRVIPGVQEGLLWLVVPVGLAVLFALGAGLTKGVINLIVLVLGAVAGTAIVLAVLDLFGLDLGLVDWLLALVGAVVGASLLSRFTDWTLIFLAAIVGALLTMRGLQMLIPSFQGVIASVIGLLLAGGSIGYHAGWFGGKASK